MISHLLPECTVHRFSKQRAEQNSQSVHSSVSLAHYAAPLALSPAIPSTDLLDADTTSTSFITLFHLYARNPSTDPLTHTRDSSSLLISLPSSRCASPINTFPLSRHEKDTGQHRYIGTQ